MPLTSASHSGALSEPGDEAAVDLQLMDRQRAEVTTRLEYPVPKSSSENRTPRSASVVSVAATRSGSSMRRLSVISSVRMPRGSGAIISRQTRHEVRFGELARRHVHRDVEGGTMTQASHDLFEDPPTQRDDQPGVLGQRDELARQHEAEVGMVPAHERLGRHRPTRTRCRRWAGSGRSARPVRARGAGR